MMKVLAALAAIAMLSHAVAADEYVWQEDKPSGNFTFSKVDMKLQGGGSDWKPRAIAQVVMQGRTEKKITAGTLKYQVYQRGVTKFIASGNFAYFKCGPHGCHPDEPLSLDLDDPNAASSDFTLTWQFQMPYSMGPFPDYTVVVWGEDQDHEPYDFSGRLFYNTSSTSGVKVEAESAAREVIIDSPWKHNCTNGNFTVDNVQFYTDSGVFEPQALAHVTLKGNTLKQIDAGTVKYQIYEGGVRSFIQSLNFPFFKCNNKGCDRNQPISLDLQDRSGAPGPYTLTFEFLMPARAESPGAQKNFRLIFWAQDQDHFPYDFSCDIDYSFGY